MPLIGARNVREMLKEDDPVYRANMELVKLMMKQSALYRDENKTNQRISEPQIAFQFGKLINNFLTTVRNIGDNLRSNISVQVSPSLLTSFTSKYGELATYYNTFVKPLVSKNPFIKREMEQKIQEMLSVINDNMTSRISVPPSATVNPIRKKASEIFNYVYENIQNGTFGSNIPQTSMKYQDIQERTTVPVQQFVPDDVPTPLTTMYDFREAVFDYLSEILVGASSLVEELDAQTDGISDPDKFKDIIFNYISSFGFENEDELKEVDNVLNQLLNNYKRNITDFIKRGQSASQFVEEKIDTEPDAEEKVSEDVVDEPVSSEPLLTREHLQQQQQQQQRTVAPPYEQPSFIRGVTHPTLYIKDLENNLSIGDDDTKIKYIRLDVLPYYLTLKDTKRDTVKKQSIRNKLDIYTINGKSGSQILDEFIRSMEPTVVAPPLSDIEKRIQQADTYEDVLNSVWSNRENKFNKRPNVIYRVNVLGTARNDPRTDYYVGNTKLKSKELEYKAEEKIKTLPKLSRADIVVSEPSASHTQPAIPFADNFEAEKNEVLRIYKDDALKTTEEKINAMMESVVLKKPNKQALSIILQNLGRGDDNPTNRLVYGELYRYLNPPPDEAQAREPAPDTSPSSSSPLASASASASASSPEPEKKLVIVRSREDFNRLKDNSDLDTNAIYKLLVSDKAGIYKSISYFKPTSTSTVEKISLDDAIVEIPREEARLRNIESKDKKASEYEGDGKPKKKKNDLSKLKSILRKLKK